MNRLIYAASEQCANLWYESGFSAPDAFLWFEVNGQRYIVLSPLEIGRAQKQARKDVNVLSFEEAKQRWQTPNASPEALLPAIAKADNATVWHVPADFPFGLARNLEKQGLSLEVLTPFSPAREAKNADEIAAIRRAVAITEDGLNRAFEILRAATVGPDDILRWNGDILTAEILRGEINIAIARQGGTASGTITAPGVHGADPHCQGYGPIRAHEPIVMDVFPRSDTDGYFGDLTRTVVKGSAPDIVRKTYETVRQAQLIALDMLRPGIPGATPHNAVADYFKEQGYVTDTVSAPARGFFHGLGHSIGLEIHEGPGLSPRNAKPLVPGNVVTVEPGLYYPEWGGIRIEDDAVITDTAAEKLSSLPVFLEL